MDSRTDKLDPVSVKQDCEICERARRLGCTEEDLREAVKAVANLLSLEHDDEICDWAMSLCCTEAELCAAVEAAGYPGAVRAAGDPLFPPGEFNDV